MNTTDLGHCKVTNSWLLNIDNGKINSAVFLDIRKAFDTVDYKILLDKLKWYDMPENEIIGPLLFIIYMNDLPLFVKDAEITMYAYDTSLLKAFTTINQLQEELIPAFAKVCEWLKTINLV